MFTSSDVGKLIVVGTSPTGSSAALVTTIQSYQSVTQVTLAASSSGALSNVLANINTDDTASMQAAIDAASAGGGTVLVPPGDYYANLTMKQGVTLTSLDTRYRYTPSSAAAGSRAVIIRSASAGTPTVDTPTSAIGTPAINGINFIGHGAASIGVNLRNTQWASVTHCSFDSYKDQGLLAAAGNATFVDDVLTSNCLLNRSRSAVAGAVEIATHDSIIRGFEAGVGTASLTSSNRYCQGLLVSGTNCFISDGNGELSDGGVYVSGNYNRFVNVRADLNRGHGFEITGNRNTFASCHAVNNSQDATNTYDGWLISGTSNSFAACRSAGASNGIAVKYGFEDTVSQAGVSTRNTYDASCRSTEHGTAPFSSQTYVGSGREMPPHDLHPANSTASVDITGTSLVICDLYTTPTTVTAFTGGVQGQSLRIVGSANVTIQNNSTIKTNTGADKPLAANQVYTFTLAGGVWRENAGSSSASTFASEVSAPDVKVTGLTGAANPGRFVGVTVSGAPTSGTFTVGDFVVTQNGNMYVCVTPGSPGVWVAPRDTTNMLTSGQESLPRDRFLFGQTIGSAAFGSGSIRGTQFVARKSETLTKVKVVTGTTAAGATPTLCKVAVYSVAADNTHTLLSASASDTTLFAAVNTAYTVPLSAGVSLTAGSRYTVAVIVVSAATMPTLVGMPSSVEYAASPAMTLRADGQTDMPATIAPGSISNNAGPIYAVLLP
jgi:hypothetical protein